MTKEKAAPDMPKDPCQLEGDGAGKNLSKVLIVDSNQRDRERCSASLDGFDVIHCDNGIQAIRIAERNQTICIAIALWELPGDMGGAEFVSWLRRQRPDVPVIVTTALLDLSRAATAKAMGASDVFMKPLDAKKLRATVDALLNPIEPPLFEELMKRMIGESPEFLNSLRHLARIIPRDEPVLLTGESGTGKELFARAVHDLGQNAKEPFVAVNMPGLAENLVESELFGHEKGAFTGATELRPGAFEICGSGTLFLDEIGELKADLQAKLLRVVQQRVFQRVGGNKGWRFTGRLVCATNRDLVQAIDRGEFRDDLYHRICVHEVRTVPLRNRGGDIWRMSEYFLRDFAQGREIRLSREVNTILTQYPFYGNVRELMNLIADAVANCSDTEIGVSHFPVERMLERVNAVEKAVNPDEFRWPPRLLDETFPEALTELENALAREYLPRILALANHRIGAATRKSGFKDPKTFRSKWTAAGLPPLNEKDEKEYDQHAQSNE